MLYPLLHRLGQLGPMREANGERRRKDVAGSTTRSRRTDAQHSRTRNSSGRLSAAQQTISGRAAGCWQPSRRRDGERRVTDRRVAGVRRQRRRGQRPGRRRARRPSSPANRRPERGRAHRGRGLLRRGEADGRGRRAVASSHPSTAAGCGSGLSSSDDDHHGARL